MPQGQGSPRAKARRVPDETSGGQTELFAALPDAVSGGTGGAVAEQVDGSGPRAVAIPEQPGPARSHAAGARDRQPASLSSTARIALHEALLEASSPLRAGSKAAAWLKSRRIFKKTWEGQGLRVVDNYRRVSEDLLSSFPLAELQAGGLFNKDGHLRFYRHSLLVPWFDAGHPTYLQAFAPEDDAVPPELSVTGAVPHPYNARLLDGAPGRLYLCSGALDAMELLEAGFPAVGVPGAVKTPWLSRFRNKSVYIAFDGDAEGEAAAVAVIATLGAAKSLGVETHRLAVPAGKRVCEWVAGR